MTHWIRRSWPWPIIFLVIIFLSLITFLLPARAQNGLAARLSPPEPVEFPEMKAYLDLISPAGNFYAGLEDTDVQLFENQQPRELLQFRELTPGVQLVLAVNIAPPFAIQDVSGQSRWDYIQENLASWAAQTEDTTSDDLSILTNDGLERTHLQDRQLLATLIERYNPTPRETPSNLNVLSRAIEVAADPTPALGMKKIVLLLTPPPTPEEVASLENMTSLALAHDVRIYPWMVSSPAFFTSAGAEQLQVMAEKTGGRYFAFSGTEAIPDLEAIFSSLRGTYLLHYRSGITSPGNQELQVVLSLPNQELSTTTTFSLDIQPPNPILVAPPQEITRQNPEPEQETFPLEDYQPESVKLEAIIEFPDGLPRDLSRTILIVDGNILDENENPPFNTFTWDLSSYQQTGTHYLTIQAEDELGLKKDSVSTPVRVIVPRPNLTLVDLIMENKTPFFGLVSLVVGAGVILVLIFRGVIQPKDILGGRTRITFSPGPSPSSTREGPPSAREAHPDRVRNSTPATREENEPAYLIPEEDPAQTLFESRIPLDKEEITIGSDPSSAIIPIADPSVESLHARLIKSSDREYRLVDQGSETGTWINHQQLLAQRPGHLQDGDLLHIGRVGFRFHTADGTTRATNRTS